MRRIGRIGIRRGDRRAGAIQRGPHVGARHAVPHTVSRAGFRDVTPPGQSRLVMRWEAK